MVFFSRSRSSVPHVFVLHDPWPGCFSRGQKLVEGAFWKDGLQWSRLQPTVWQTKDWPSLDQYVHSFIWLRDLRTIGDGYARLLCRDLIDNWLQAFTKFRLWSDRSEGQFEIMAERLSHWMSLYEFYGSSANDAFKNRLIESLIWQLRQLQRLSPRKIAHLNVSVLKALIMGEAFLFKSGHTLGYLRLLQSHITTHLFENGLHRSCVPMQHLSYLQHLLDIRQLLTHLRFDSPYDLNEPIRKMGIQLRQMRHGDGRLATFGCGEDRPSDLVDIVLSQAFMWDGTIRLEESSFFHRAEMGQGILIVASSSLPGSSACAPFELSYGGERFFVTHRSDETCSHSGLSVLNGRSTLRKWRFQNDGSVAYHQGEWDIVAPAPFRYLRHMYWSQEGADLRAEEILYTAQPQTAQLTFSLMPDCQVHILNQGQRAYIYTPLGREWRLMVSEGSQMMAGPQGYYKSEEIWSSAQSICIQIPLSALGPEPTIFKWALSRQ